MQYRVAKHTQQSIVMPVIHVYIQYMRRLKERCLSYSTCVPLFLEYMSFLVEKGDGSYTSPLPPSSSSNPSPRSPNM